MQITPEFLQKALDNLKKEIFETLHVSMPGVINSYDPENQTADIQPGLMRKTSDGRLLPSPLLRNVPIIGSTESLSPGDLCLLIFTDFCLDGFLQTHTPTLPPSPRTHDLSDAIAIVGFPKEAKTP